MSNRQFYFLAMLGFLILANTARTEVAFGILWALGTLFGVLVMFSR
jgi:hypothetical protein